MAKIATFLFIGFILFTLWVKRNEYKDFSPALWIPQIWMFFAGSRYLSKWLELRTSYSSRADAYEEGSPLDATVFFALIMAGLFVLLHRRLDANKLLVQNYWIGLYFVFGVASILWSDYSIVSAKRLFKATGNVIMAMIVLSEKRPYEAAAFLLLRHGIFLLPLSVLFIKYYPAWGRTYSGWFPYEVMVTGVATQKNTLGQICLLTGMSLCWAFLLKRKEKDSGGKLGALLNLVLAGMIAWLLYKADSATSLACLVAVVSILLVSRLPAFARDPHRIIALGVVFICIVGILELSLDISGAVVRLLGRDENLTTRVPMWNELIRIAPNPIVGVGYESFWLGARLEAMWNFLGTPIVQAHNGFLEVYLNLGLIGLTLLLGSMASGVMKVLRNLKTDYPGAMLRLCFIVTAALYNWTEATFYGVSNMWVVLLLGVMQVPAREPQRAPALSNSRFGSGKNSPQKTQKEKQVA